MKKEATAGNREKYADVQVQNLSDNEWNIGQTIDIKINSEIECGAIKLVAKLASVAA